MKFGFTNFLENAFQELFSFKGNYLPQEWVNLDTIKDKDKSFIGEFLYTHFNDVYDFINSVGEMVYIPEYDGIAAITLKEGRPVIILNPHRFTYIFKELSKKGYQICYLVAGILYHEMLHYVFKHFRVPSQGYDHTILNYAQDIAIDNFIKTKIEFWRNWAGFIEKINENIRQKGLPFPQITLGKEEGKISVFNLCDIDLYLYITEAAVQQELEKTTRLDNHGWSENLPKISSQGYSQSSQQSKIPKEKTEQQTTGSGGKTNIGEDEAYKKPSKPSKEKDEDIANELYYKFIQKQRKKAEEKEKFPTRYQWKGNTIEEVYKLIDDTKTYDLYNILRRYVRKLSEKQKRQTWHKINKRYPFLYPGNIYEKQIGEIFLVIDISLSMRRFLEHHLAKVVSDIYNSFEKLAKIYTPDIKLYYTEVDDSIRRIKELKKIDELKNIRVQAGVNTDYTCVFNYIKDWSKNIRKFNKYSQNKYPDLIIFISDFGTASIKNMDETLGKAIDNNLLWIYTGNNLNLESFKPKFGKIVNAFSFFKLKEREVYFRNA
jgi:predicted metal-dependent peptidase